MPSLADEAHPQGLTISVGAQSVPLANAADIAALVEARNQQRRLPGLPDDLDPTLIDPGKAARFVTALPSLAPDLLARMNGQTIPLDWAGLGLGTAAPTEAGDFASPLQLVVDDVSGTRVLAHVTTPPHLDLARSRAGKAQSALPDAERMVRAIERQRAAGTPGQEDLSMARLRRYRIAEAWRTNARAWVALAPGDRTGKTALAKADKAAKDYFMPAGVE